MTSKIAAPVTCPRRALLDALAACAVPVTAQTAHLPALQAVRLTSETGQLHLTTTDLELEVRATVAVPDIEPGVDALVDHATLTRAVTALGKGERKSAADALPVNLHPDSTLDVAAAGFSAPLELLSTSSADRPAAPEIEATHLVDTERFRAAVARVGHAVGTDPLLPVFTHINTTLGEDGITLTATDRFRATEETMPAVASAAAGTALLPAKPLAKLLRRMSADTIGVGIGSVDSAQWITLTSTNLRVTVRSGEGEFPRLNTILKQDRPELARLDRAELSKATAKLGALDPDRNAYVELTGTPAGVTVNGRTATGPTLDGNTTEADWSTRLSPSYLQAALQAFPTETICLATSPGEVKPVTVTSPELPDFVTVIMPLRTHDH